MKNEDGENIDSLIMALIMGISIGIGFGIFLKKIGF